MNLLLFEEPEAFLHPPQQQRLCRDIIKLSTSPDWQVLATTHSSHFVSKSTNRLSSLIHLSKEKGTTEIRQILINDWNEIVTKNGMLDVLAQKYPELVKQSNIGDDDSNSEALRYFLFLNSEHANAFFSTRTLLVEGGTEVGFISRLIDEGKIPLGTGVCIFDSFGKYNVHRFMNLFGKLGIRHSVIIDDDSDKKGNRLQMQQDINQMILDSKNEYTEKVITIPENLESFLNTQLNLPSYQKPQAILMKYDNGEISEERISAFINLVNQSLS